jgi:hypothetical protein
MLDLVEFQFIDCSPHIIGCAPFSDMCLQAQPGRLGFSIERFESADGLREFVTRQIQRPMKLSSRDSLLG